MTRDDARAASAGPPTFPLRSPLPMASGALALGLAGAALLAAAGGGLAWLLAGLSLLLAVAAAVAVHNLVRHEGWAVVVGDDALELPTAPIRGRRRDRIPYGAIGFVGRSPAGEAPVAIIEVEPGPVTRWVREADLRRGTVDELVALVVARVAAVRGPGTAVTVGPPRGR